MYFECYLCYYTNFHNSHIKYGFYLKLVRKLYYLTIVLSLRTFDPFLREGNVDWELPLTVWTKSWALTVWFSIYISHKMGHTNSLTVYSGSLDHVLEFFFFFTHLVHTQQACLLHLKSSWRIYTEILFTKCQIVYDVLNSISFSYFPTSTGLEVCKLYLWDALPSSVMSDTTELLNWTCQASGFSANFLLSSNIEKCRQSLESWRSWEICKYWPSAIGMHTSGFSPGIVKTEVEEVDEVSPEAENLVLAHVFQYNHGSNFLVFSL